MKIIIFCLIAITLIFSAFAPSEALSDKKQTISSQVECQGNALCVIDGTVTKIVDGDTLWVKGTVDGVKKYKKIRLSLTSTPELYDKKGVKIKEGFEAKNFLMEICPRDSSVVVDQDDKQPFDKNKRLMGKVTCSGKVLNSELLYSGHATISTKFCSKSEFASEAWAKKFGCK